MQRSKVYIEIRDRLKERMAQLKTVDLQKGQFKNQQQHLPVPMPAALIELRPLDWQHATGGQIADAVASVSLYLDLVTDSFDEAEQNDETLAILDSLDELNEALSGFSGTDFGSAMRLRDGVDHYGADYVCLKADFRFALFDNKPVRRIAKPNVNFEPNIK